MMNCVHKEGGHSGEGVTLVLLPRLYYLWMGMAGCVKWWLRRCYTCQAHKHPKIDTPCDGLLVSRPLASGPGQMVYFDLLEDLPDTDNRNKYLVHPCLVVNSFSRHTEAYGISSGEQTTKRCASKPISWGLWPEVGVSIYVVPVRQWWRTCVQRLQEVIEV